MRGKAVPAALPDVTHGITPAYAGKSTPDRLFLYHLGDHPRVCGEKQGQKDSIINQLGSPPRVQGKVWAL